MESEREDLGLGSEDRTPREMRDISGAKDRDYGGVERRCRPSLILSTSTSTIARSEIFLPDYIGLLTFQTGALASLRGYGNCPTTAT